MWTCGSGTMHVSHIGQKCPTLNFSLNINLKWQIENWRWQLENWRFWRAVLIYKDRKIGPDRSDFTILTDFNRVWPKLIFLPELTRFDELARKIRRFYESTRNFDNHRYTSSTQNVGGLLGETNTTTHKRKNIETLYL